MNQQWMKITRIRLKQCWHSCALIFSCCLLVMAAEKPNIILMVADDLGYADLGCYGAQKIATPCIDSIATDGVRFTDAHSFSGICMPSRYSKFPQNMQRLLKYQWNEYEIGGKRAQ